jgi:hypothetical protein
MPRRTTDLVTLASSLAAILALLAAEGGARPVAGLRTAFELIDRKEQAHRLAARLAAEDEQRRHTDR